MAQIVLIIVALLSLNTASAQLSDTLNCPKIKIDGPYNNVIGERSKLQLSVKPFHKEYEKTHDITYNWVVNNSKIIGKSNERKVQIETKDLLGQKIDVTVMISGLDAGCPSIKTETFDVVAPSFRTETKVVKGRVFMKAN